MVMSRLPVVALCGCAFLAAASAPAAAQWRPQAWAGPGVAVRSGPAAQPQPPAMRHENARPAYGRMIRGGLVGGAAGAGLGLLSRGSSGDIGSAVSNASLGAALGIPVGVHVGNRTRGSLLLSGLASLGIGGLALSSAGTGGNAVPLLVAASVAELGVSVYVERVTMHRGARP